MSPQRSNGHSFLGGRVNAFRSSHNQQNINIHWKSKLNIPEIRRFTWIYVDFDMVRKNPNGTSILFQVHNVKFHSMLEWLKRSAGTVSPASCEKNEVKSRVAQVKIEPLTFFPTCIFKSYSIFTSHQTLYTNKCLHLKALILPNKSVYIGVLVRTRTLSERSWCSRKCW